MLGIMGRSGSGKTTVTRLLQRLHPGYEGMIKIDGMDLREIDLDASAHATSASCRRRISCSPAPSAKTSPWPAATRASQEIVRAAQLAGAEEFIERLPRGYDTRSRGRRRPTSPAANASAWRSRARCSSIRRCLILDEATSALDAESEAIVNANLKRMAKGRTVICNLAPACRCWWRPMRSWCWSAARSTTSARHEELLQRCDIYKHMWYQQNRYADRSSPNVPIASAQAS